MQLYPRSGLILWIVNSWLRCAERLYKSADDFFGHVLNVRNPLISPDFTDPPGYFYIMKLEAGTYEIVHAGLMKEIIRFEMGEREIVYVGELQFRLIPGCGTYVKLPGCKPNVDNAVVPTVNNRWDRDKNLTRERLKNYGTDSVTVRLAKVFKD